LTRLYFDSAYLVKIYIGDADSDKVRKLVTSTETVCSSALCLAEFACAVLRVRREISVSVSEAAEARLAFLSHIRAGLVTLVPISESILYSVQAVVETLPTTLFLRAGDAIHLASAEREGFSEIWTNDRHMLKAASHFGLTGRSV
jgi:predicted nucleic acid-binding protein